MESLISHGGVENIPEYNCSYIDPLKPLVHGFRSRLIIGIISSTYGALMILLYIPTIVVLSKKDLLKNVCYKVMFTMCIVDASAVCANSLLTGLFHILGWRFCSAPLTLYVHGSVCMFTWTTSCCLCFSLACLRLTELHSSGTCTFILFRGYKGWILPILSLAYGILFALFNRPAIFNSDYFGVFFSPFIDGIPDALFESPFHSANNIAMVVGNTLLYIAFIVALLTKYRSGGGNRAKIVCLLQSGMICFFHFNASLIYVIIQFETTAWLITTGTIFYQLTHGFPAVIYLVMNRTIRVRVRGLLRPPVRPFTEATRLGMGRASGIVTAHTHSQHIAAVIPQQQAN